LRAILRPPSKLDVQFSLAASKRKTFYVGQPGIDWNSSQFLRAPPFFDQPAGSWSHVSIQQEENILSKPAEIDWNSSLRSGRAANRGVGKITLHEYFTTFLRNLYEFWDGMGWNRLERRL
jgi:hypothetical protein